MIAQSLRTHFRARLPEWFMMGWLLTYGAYVVLHPQMFTAPATRAVLSGMTQLAAYTGFHPAAIWGLSAVIIAMVRGCALFINGAYTRSPLIRLLTSVASACIVLVIVLGQVKNGVPNTGIPTYAWLLMLDIMSAYIAASDLPLAERNRLIDRRNRRVDQPGHA